MNVVRQNWSAIVLQLAWKHVLETTVAAPKSTQIYLKLYENLKID